MTGALDERRVSQSPTGRRTDGGIRLSSSAAVPDPPLEPPAALPLKPFWCPNCLHHYADAACDGCGRVLTLAAGRRAPSLCRSDAPQFSIPQTNGPALTPENAGDGPSTTEESTR